MDMSLPSVVDILDRLVYYYLILSYFGVCKISLFYAYTIFSISIILIGCFDN